MQLPHKSILHPNLGRRAVMFLALSAALCFASPLHAQLCSSQADGAPAPAPVLQPSPTAAMKAFEPAENEEYLLGPGDEISIDVPGRPELTVKRTIGPDGRIGIPVVPTSIQLGGMTRDQAGAAIAQSLTSYYSQVSATISIDKYAGNRVLVLGNVEHPGVLQFDSTPTLLEAISRAGLAQQRDKPMGVPERVAIYRGNDQVIWVDLRSLLEKGNSFADLRLRRNDLVYVPSDSDRTVSVMGAVQHPGSVHLTSNSTLAQVLSEAGGITDAAGGSPKIQIIDPTTCKTRLIDYKTLLTPSGALEVSLHQGEIIYVPPSKFYKVTYVMERLNPATTVMTMAAMYH